MVLREEIHKDFICNTHPKVQGNDSGLLGLWSFHYRPFLVHQAPSHCACDFGMLQGEVDCLGDVAEVADTVPVIPLQI